MDAFVQVGDCGNIGEFTLSGSIPFYIVLMLLSIAAVVLLIADVEKRDVM